MSRGSAGDSRRLVFDDLGAAGDADAASGGVGQIALLDVVTAAGGSASWRLRLLLGPVPGRPSISEPPSISLLPGNVVITSAANGSTAPFLVLSVSAPTVFGPSGVAWVDLVVESTEILTLDEGVLHLYRLSLRGVPQVHPQFDSAYFLLDIDRGAPVESLPPTADTDDLPFAINYLAKDYTELRQVILGQMALRIPEWKGKNAADIGIMLVELLAYVGDYLSYYQDAVATETYLSTARRRISVRRHARLLGYRMHDGYNSRVWVHIAVSSVLELPARTPLVAQGGEIPAVILEADLRQEIGRNAKFFETLEPIRLRPELNQLEIYTFGLEDCTLERGGTSATLVDESVPDGLDAEARRLEKLRVGDVLVFEQILNPRTGKPDRNLTRWRHAVRVTSVSYSPPVPGVSWIRVTWDAEDALPFDLVVSRRLPDRQIFRAAVARGNIVPADSGLTVRSVLPPVPSDVPYEPYLPTRRLVQADSWNAHAERRRPAASAFQQQATDAMPAVVLVEEGFPASENPPWRDLRPSNSLPMTGSQPVPVVPRKELKDAESVWTPIFDLLRSPPTAQNFVAETENDGTVRLRFGDGHLGRLPTPGHRFVALFREGNRRGTPVDDVAGNDGSARGGAVGSDSINSLAAPDLARYEVWNGAITEVRNPLSSSSDMAPETLESVRALAPSDYQIQRSALTADDWVGIAECQAGVAKATARVFFGGSWPVALVRVLRAGDLPTDPAFLERIAARLQSALPAGRTLSVQGPLWIGLDILLAVDLKMGYFPDDVMAELRAVLGNRAYFDPLRWNFGATIYASGVLTSALEVEGVQDAQILRFRKLGRPVRSPKLSSRTKRSRLQSKERGAGVPHPAELKLEFGELPRVSSDPRLFQTGGIQFRISTPSSIGSMPVGAAG